MSRNIESIFGAVVTAPHQIPFTYTATGGEQSISLPFFPLTGFITINGGVQVPVDNYEIDGNTIHLGRTLEADDVVYCLFDKIISPEDQNKGVRIYKFQAVGGETQFTPDFTSYGVQALFVDGKYKVPDTDYSYNPQTGKVTLSSVLVAGVWVVAEMSTKLPNTTALFNRTIQEVARAANVQDSAVINSTDTISTMDNKTVIFDVVAQKIWGIPTGIPSGAKIVSVTNGILVYNPGAVTANLKEIPGSAKEFGQFLAASTGTGMVGYGNTTLDKQLSAFMGTAVNVKHPQFGAKGDWNATTMTGTDDSAAFQAALDSLVNTYRKGGYRYVYIPAGNYKVGSLVIKQALEFGVMFVGDGKYCSIIWGDETTGNPVITSEIEFVHFHGLSLYGCRKQSTTPADWAACFYKGKLASNAPDVDVTFSDCALGHAVDFVQAYGRGVVIDPSCVAFFCTYLLNIVCDSSTVFPGGATNAYQTGMRNYNLCPSRTDVVSRMFRVTGTAAWKDYINDISVRGVNMLSADLIGEFADATVTQLNVSGISALNSFSSGLLMGKRLINTLLDVMAEKQYNRDAASTGYITGLVTLTGGFQNLQIRGMYKDLVHHVVQAGAASAGLDINIMVANLASDGQAFTAMTGANVISNNINIVATGAAPAGSCAFFSSATQTDPKFRCTAYGANFTRPGVIYNPNLLIGATAQTPVYRTGTYRVEGGLVEVEIAYSYSRAASSTSQVSMSLPVQPAAEYPSLSAVISGYGLVKYSSYKGALRPEIVPGSSSVIFFKADGNTLTEADLPSTFAITLKVQYPQY